MFEARRSCEMVLAAVPLNGGAGETLQAPPLRSCWDSRVGSGKE